MERIHGTHAMRLPNRRSRSREIGLKNKPSFVRPPPSHDGRTEDCKRYTADDPLPSPSHSEVLPPDTQDAPDFCKSDTDESTSPDKGQESQSWFHNAFAKVSSLASAFGKDSTAFGKETAPSSRDGGTKLSASGSDGSVDASMENPAAKVPENQTEKGSRDGGTPAKSAPGRSGDAAMPTRDVSTTRSPSRSRSPDRNMFKLVVQFSNKGFCSKLFETERAIARIEDFWNSPATLLAVAEITEADIKQLTTFEEDKMFEPRFTAGPEFGGVCLLGKRKHVRWIDMATDGCVKAVSSLFFKSDKRGTSTAIAYRVAFDCKLFATDCSDMVFIVAHLGHEHAKRYEIPKDFYDWVQKVVDETDCRVMCGDLNLQCYNAVTEMKKRGIDMTLAAYHTNINKTSPEHFDRAVNFDCNGIFIIRPCYGITSLPQQYHALVAAMWPQNAGRKRHPEFPTNKKDKVKFHRNGSQAMSYMGTRPIEDVGLIDYFDNDITELLKNKVHTWEKPSPAGEEQWLYKLDTDGEEKFQKLCSSLKANHKVEQPPSYTSDGGGWWRLGHTKEMMSKWTWADPTGELYGYGAHMNLLVCITNVGCTYPHGPPYPEPKNKAAIRHRGKDGREHELMKHRKNRYCRLYKSWPWWLWDHMEPTYYINTQRKHFKRDAARWRWAEDYYLESSDDPDKKAKLQAYNNQYIRLYGLRAYEDALKASEEPYREARWLFNTYEEFVQRFFTESKTYIHDDDDSGSE